MKSPLVAVDLLQAVCVSFIVKWRIKMEKRPIYASVIICTICFLYSIITYGSDYLLGWGYFIVGGLLIQNYLIKK